VNASWLVIAVAGGLLSGGVSTAAAPAVSVDPKVVSVYPFTAQRGATFTATVRGNGLRDATAVFLNNAPLTATIEASESEAPDKSTKGKFDLVQLRIQIDPGAKPGRYPLRLVTPRGISNSVMLHVVDYSVAAEPEGSHETPDSAVPVNSLPAVINGRIARRGESDYYSFDVKAGQTLTFEAISGLPSIGAPGGNAAGFDPSLSLFEASGSWFDPKRVNRIAANDEPLWVIGQLTDAYLVHKFEKAGRYLMRIEAFSGQGGPDYGYQLKILDGEAPQDRQPASRTWDERTFPRSLSADRLNELADRGGKPKKEKSIESYRAAAAAGSDAPLFKIPGTLEGSLTHPGEAHRARFHLDSPQDIAIEIETPSAAPPLFNPIVRLLDAAGEEIATNIFVGRGACNGEMNKSIQAKTLLPLRDPGDYTVEIRDTTSSLAEPDFRYRVQVRPQIPHIGRVRIDEDHINLAPGEAKTVRVTFDREEGYTGAVAVIAESLPEGVQALAGADFEPDKDPPRFTGKRERYTPRTERVVVVFTANADALVTKQPQMTRLAVRPVAGGKPGAVVETKQFPLMVVAKP
jgi:hypothetical protein